MVMSMPLMLLTDLPAGFRFHPSDQELVVHYLQTRAGGEPCPFPIFGDLDIYKYNPWDLSTMALFGDREWYFFTPRDHKYPNGLRLNRTAAAGFWKETGNDKLISLDYGDGVIDPHPVAVKKALVFYIGRPPTETKTRWIMHEYHLLAGQNTSLSSSSTRLDEWVVCRIFSKTIPVLPLPGLDIPPGQELAHRLPPPGDQLATTAGSNIVYGYDPPANMIQNNNNNNMDYYVDVSDVLLNFHCEFHLNQEIESEAISEITGAGEFSEADAMVVNSVASGGDTTAASHHPLRISDSDQQIESSNMLMDQQQQDFN